MVQIAWARRALRDISEIQTYIGQFDPHAANAYVEKLRAAANNLTDFPNRGRKVGSNLRELVIVPPYVIRYRLTATTVYITRIKHGRQLR